MEHSEAKALMRLQTKLREQGGVIRPEIVNSAMCWAEVRIHTGQRFPTFVPCMKLARKGCLTCHSHRAREDDAQRLREG